MDYFSRSTPDRQEPNHEPVRIRFEDILPEQRWMHPSVDSTLGAGGHILHAVCEMYDAHTLREMADAFRRIADEKEGIS
jgi:hypothetical protein